MITGTFERSRMFLHTSVPLMPGSIRSSNTMSMWCASNSASAVGPSPATRTSNPSFFSRNASGSASAASSSTIRTEVTGGSSFLLEGRQFEGEGRSRAGPAPNLNGALVVCDDVLDDGQPQAGAARRPGPRLVHAEEPLEDALLIGQRNADAAVRDPDGDGVAVGHLHRDADRRLLRRVVDGIGDQVR